MKTSVHWESPASHFTEAASDTELTEKQLADATGGEHITAVAVGAIAVGAAVGEAFHGSAAVAGIAAVAKPQNW